MHVDRVRRLLSDHGGSVVQGGGVDLATRMVEPTIVLDPVPSSALPAEEIFAPILPVVSVPSAEEAIASVAARPAPSTCSRAHGHCANEFLPGHDRGPSW